MEKEKATGRRVVLCHGVFDLLHIGHIRYLRRAKEFGDVLVVTLTQDVHVDKGPGRPAFTERLRAEALASLGFVDYVAVNLWPTAEETLRVLKPNYYVKGAEFRNLSDDTTGKIALESAVAKEVGTELVFIEDIVFSSSNLINQHLSVYPEELTQYLNLLRQRFSPDQALEIVDRMKDIKVLVIGDAIVDQYAYCSPLGLSSKDPTMALRQLSCEHFPGGAIAVARHVAGLSDHVGLFTIFGENCPYIDMMKDSLPQNVQLTHAQAHGAPTVRKLRYVDSYSLAKLLEIYHMSADPLPEELVQNLLNNLKKIIYDYDLILVADYGHGLITGAMVDFLCHRASYLAVNTQANAGNRGFHTILRYPRADFISLARHEIKLAFRDRQSPELELMTVLQGKLNPKTLLVTCGSDGLKALTETEYVQTPALTTRTVIDRVGAGDALFAATALAAWLKCPLELLGLIGNIAGARQVETLGNNASLAADTVKKALTAMLK
jgi:rfaE bifunctional protein nucleotidyltransferase chain/domain